MPRPRRRKPSTIELPLLPRRRGILFPNTSGPILVGRKTSLRAVDEATAAEGIVAVVTQRDPSMSDLAPDDVFPIATESIVNRALRLPDGTTQVWVQGLRRLRIVGFAATEPCYRAIVEPVDIDKEWEEAPVRFDLPLDDHAAADCSIASAMVQRMEREIGGTGPKQSRGEEKGTSQGSGL